MTRLFIDVPPKYSFSFVRNNTRHVHHARNSRYGNNAFACLCSALSCRHHRGRREFGKGIKFVVAKKADSLYKTVSAASIVAKARSLCFPFMPAAFCCGVKNEDQTFTKIDVDILSHPTFCFFLAKCLNKLFCSLRPPLFRSRTSRVLKSLGIVKQHYLEPEQVFLTNGWTPTVPDAIPTKVTRDRIVEGWRWSEPNLDFSEDRNYGSGYPGDEKCKKWLESNVDPVFGFPDICRFSWGTTKEILKGPTRKRVDW